MTLKKDNEEYGRVIKSYQEKEILNAHKTQELSNQEQLLATKLEDRIKELQSEKELLRAEQDRMS